MNKEELEKRAKEYARKEVYYGAYVDEEVGMEIAEEAYIEATERETKLLQKRNEELEKENEMFKKANEIIAQQRDGRDETISILEKRIEELEAKIEEMKCCSMCKYYCMSFLPYFCTKNGTSPHCTSNCDKWEIKEK